MTKLDGDARGGAALSVKAVTGVPIKFIGTGEHLDALEEFHPDRMASRILGMGDVLTLVEAGPAEVRPGRDGPSGSGASRRANSRSTIFASMLGQMRKLGPLSKVLGMIPGMGGAQGNDGRRRRRAGYEPAVRHHRFDDARRAAQSLANRSTRAAAAASPPARESSRTRSTSWSSSSTAWPA